MKTNITRIVLKKNQRAGTLWTKITTHLNTVIRVLDPNRVPPYVSKKAINLQPETSRTKNSKMILKRLHHKWITWQFFLQNQESKPGSEIAEAHSPYQSSHPRSIVYLLK